MIALALSMCLAAAGGPGDADLPRSLGADEGPYLVVPAAKEGSDVYVGLHLGVAGAYDAEDPTFLFGGGARTHLLPWLGADLCVDFQLKQAYEHREIHVFQVPVQLAGLFYLPLELPVRLYGQAGVGITITTIGYSGTQRNNPDTTELNLLFFLGFGAEFALNDNVLLDANLRFFFAGDPPRFAGNSADWAQFTVGLMIKLSK